jgi:hypothetical protein
MGRTGTNGRTVDQRPELDGAVVQEDLPVGAQEGLAGDRLGIAVRQSTDEIVDGVAEQLVEAHERIAFAPAQVIDQPCGGHARPTVRGGRSILVTPTRH